MAEAVNRPNLTFAVSPKYLSYESKIYIFIAKIPRGVYIIFLGFLKNFIFPTPGRYLQTSALNYHCDLIEGGVSWLESDCYSMTINQKIQTLLYGRQDVTRYICIKIFPKQEVMNGR